MITILLWVHVGSALLGFVLSGITSVIVLRHVKDVPLSIRFWRLQRITQWITVLLGLAGMGLYLMGRRPTDALHLLYGALAVLTIIILGAFGPNKDAKELLQGWQVNPKWILFGLNVFLWAMYGRGLTTGFFGL